MSTGVRDLRAELLVRKEPFAGRTIERFVCFKFASGRCAVNCLFSLFLRSRCGGIRTGVSALGGCEGCRVIESLLCGGDSVGTRARLVSVRLGGVVSFGAFLLSGCSDAAMTKVVRGLGSIVLFKLEGEVVASGPFLKFAVDEGRGRIRFLARRRVGQVGATRVPASEVRVCESLFLFRYCAYLSFGSVRALIPSSFGGGRCNCVCIRGRETGAKMGFYTVVFRSTRGVTRECSCGLPAIRIRGCGGKLGLVTSVYRVSGPVRSRVKERSKTYCLLGRGRLPLSMITGVLKRTAAGVAQRCTGLVSEAIFRTITGSRHRRGKIWFPYLVKSSFPACGGRCGEEDERGPSSSLVGCPEGRRGGRSYSTTTAGRAPALLYVVNVRNTIRWFCPVFRSFLAALPALFYPLLRCPRSQKFAVT